MMAFLDKIKNLVESETKKLKEISSWKVDTLVELWGSKTNLPIKRDVLIKRIRICGFKQLVVLMEKYFDENEDISEWDFEKYLFDNGLERDVELYDFKKNKC